MVKFKDSSRPSSAFQVLFKANLIFRTFQDSPVYSSTFQAYANPVQILSKSALFVLRHMAFKICYCNGFFHAVWFIFFLEACVIIISVVSAVVMLPTSVYC